MSIRKWKETDVDSLIEILENECDNNENRYHLVSHLMHKFSHKLNPHKAFKAVDFFIEKNHS